MRRALLLLLALSGATALAEPAASPRVPETGPAAEALRHEATARYRKILAGLSARGKLDDDEVLLGRVRGIARSLITVAAGARPEIGSWTWEMHVTSEPSIDAFCMAGGKILVGSEFVRRLGLADGELAMLLGHEIAHALADHRREAARGGMESDPAAEILQSEIALAQENEADRIGMTLAHRAGWPAASLVSFFDKLAQAQSPGTFSTSHPSAAARAVAARAFAQQLGP